MKLIQLTHSQIEIEPGFNRRVDYGDLPALAKSISKNGVQNPFRGKFVGDKFVLSDGHRRYEAIKLLKNKDKISIPCIEVEEDETQRIANQLICNDGLRFSPLEEAEVVNTLLEKNLTEQQIIEKTGFSGAYVSNLKLLHNAPEKIKNYIKEGVLSSTLVLDILRNSEDYDEALRIIENAIRMANSEGKEKVVKRDVVKSQGKQNSWSEMKKCYKKILNEKEALNTKNKKLFYFAEQLINGELSREDLEELFFFK